MKVWSLLIYLLTFIVRELWCARIGPTKMRFRRAIFLEAWKHC